MQLMRTVTEPRGANATSRLCLNVSGDRDVDINPNEGYSHRPAWGVAFTAPLSMYTSSPPDESATWKHRCSEKLLLAHVMQLIKPDKMH